jgi:hypothetical protein
VFQLDSVVLQLVPANVQNVWTFGVSFYIQFLLLRGNRL